MTTASFRATPPPPLRPGDRVGVAALSGKVCPQRLDQGLEALAKAGFEPVEAENLRYQAGLFAGTDDQRLAGFHRLADDPSIAAIVFARGGSGLLRVLPRIDWRRLARRPRAYVGYSDLTPFLNEVVRRLGLIAFHGPMVAVEWARGLTVDEEASFRDVLEGRFHLPIPFETIADLDGRKSRQSDGPKAPTTQAAASVSVEGWLVGGNLSMLLSTVGTPWFPSLDGGVLFWEDVNEPLYRVDRLLTHLKLSGNLQRLVAVAIGHYEPSPGSTPDLCDWKAILEEPLSELCLPTVRGIPSGHEQPNWTLPLGSKVSLDFRRGQMTVLPFQVQDASF